MDKVKIEDKELREAAEAYMAKIVEQNPNAEAYDFFNAFIAGAKWMVNNPTGGALLYVCNKQYERGLRDAKLQTKTVEL